MAPDKQANVLATRWQFPRIGIMAGLVLAIFVLAPGLGFFSLLPGNVLTSLPLSAGQRHALIETSILLFGVGAFAAFSGLITAWLTSIYEFPFRKSLTIGLFLPLAFPTYLAAYVAVDMLHFFGPVQSTWRWLIGAKTARDYRFFEIRSLFGGIVLLGLVLSPYVYVACRLVFQSSGRNIIDAARLLGAQGPRLFFRVGLPIALPALVAGCVLVLLETLNDIGATEHLGIASLSVSIRDLWLNRSDLGGAARLAAIAMLAVCGLLLLNPARGKNIPLRQAQRSRVNPERIPLQGVPALAASIACFIPVFLGFIAPVLYLASRIVITPSVTAGLAEFLQAIFTTLFVGLGTALIVGTVAAIYVAGARALPALSRMRFLTTLGYATPGTILVLASLPLFRGVESTLATLGIAMSLGASSLAIFFALSVRFLGIGTSQADLSLSKLPANVDAVARLHGLSDLSLAFKLHLPAMRPGLVLGGLLVFIDAVKELPATLLLRPPNFETLATRAYGRASAGLFEEAALESMAIVMISGLAAYLLVRKT